MLLIMNNKDYAAFPFFLEKYKISRYVTHQ